MTQVDEVGFSCSACGKQYRWKPELAGKAVKCKCGSPIRVPKQPGGVATAPAARAAHAPPPPPPPPPPAPKAKAKPAKRVEEDDGMDALYALADQEAAAGDDASTAADSQRCPACRGKMAPDAVLCLNCGFDRRKGSVLKVSVEDGDDGPPKRRLFGLLAPKKVDPSKKKKPIDKMAPQGLFVVGAGVSGALAVAAGVLWFVVAYMTQYDIYYLVALVGIAAGVGMQIGQKGYSNLGGYTAAGITLLVILIARATVFIAILMPEIKREMAAADAEDAAEVAYDRVETKDIKEMMNEQVERYAAIKAEEQARRNRESPPPTPEDPRVIQMVTEEMYRQMQIDPNFASTDQLNAAHNQAVVYAQTRPAAEKKKMIETVNLRREKRELAELMWDERVDETLKKNPNARPPHDGAVQFTLPEVEKMSPEQQKSELARLRTKMKGIRDEEQKKFEAEFAKAQAEEANDGLEDEDEMAADAGDGDEDEDAGPVKLTGKLATPAPAASSAGGTPAAAASASSSSGDEDDGDMSIAIGYMLALVVFGGHIRGILFLFAALGLAYCTAAGVSWE